MRKMAILLSVFILSGCIPSILVYHDRSDTHYEYKTTRAYQKKDMIGHTDIKQREADFFACGVKKFINGNPDGGIVYPGMTVEQATQRGKAIDTCMKNKGYIILSYTDCIDKGKPTGFCN